VFWDVFGEIQMKLRTKKEYLKDLYGYTVTLRLRPNEDQVVLLTQNTAPREFTLDFLAQSLKLSPEETKEATGKDYLLRQKMIEYLHFKCKKPFLLTDTKYKIEDQGTVQEMSSSFLLGMPEELFIQYYREARVNCTGAVDRFGHLYPEGSLHQAVYFYQGRDYVRSDEISHQSYDSSSGNYHFKSRGFPVNKEEDRNYIFKCFDQAFSFLNFNFSLDRKKSGFIHGMITDAIRITEHEIKLNVGEWDTDENGLMNPEVYPSYHAFIKKIKGYYPKEKN